MKEVTRIFWQNIFLYIVMYNSTFNLRLNFPYFLNIQLYIYIYLYLYIYIFSLAYKVCLSLAFYFQTMCIEI